MPTLRSHANRLTCRLYGFPERVAVEAEPPLQSEPAWEDHTGFSASFAMTEVLALMWSNASDISVHASLAQTHGTVDVSVAQAWDAQSHALVPCAELDVVFRMHLEAPRVSALTKAATLTVDVDTAHEHAPWDWLEVEGSPELMCLVETRAPTSAVSGAPILPGESGAASQALSLAPLDSGASKATSRLTLVFAINVAAVCGAFGLLPTASLDVGIHGHARVPLSLSARGRSSLALPTIQPAQTASHDVSYDVQVIAPGDGPAYALDVLHAERQYMPSASSQPRTKFVPRLLQIRPLNGRCVVALVETRLPVARVSAPSNACVLKVRSVNHDVWLGTADMRHRVVIEGHGALCAASYAVLFFPAEDAPTSVVARVQDHSVRATVQDQLSTTTHAEKPVPAPLCRAVTIALDTDVAGAVRVELVYSTRGALVCAGPPNVAPVYTLCIHAPEKQVPVLMCPPAEAHTEYIGSMALVTRHHVRPHVSLRVHVALHAPLATSNAAPRWLYAIVLASVCVALISTVFAASAHAALRRLDLQVESLAMALDVDFSDGQYISTPRPPAPRLFGWPWRP